MDSLTGAFALGACVSVAVLCWFGYRAVTESRGKSLLLAERQSSEAADLLLTALKRDMSGAQASILTSPQWYQFVTEHPHDVNELVASAFARYPYPDTFFAWRAEAPFERTAFFYRAERRPAWLTGNAPDLSFPVLIDREPAAAMALFERIIDDATRSRTLSFFELPLGGETYQVIAQLVYDDVYRQHLSSVVGFTVSLPWVHNHYFPDLTNQVWSLSHGPETGLVMSIRDRDGRTIAGSATDDRGALTTRRDFELLFLDAESALPSTRRYAPETWSIAVSSSTSPSLLRDSTTANRLLAFAGLSGLTFAIGLILTVRATQASARLADMRSDFVSAVTHELKTPIATIKTAAETLAKDRLTGMSVQTCGRIVMMETGRLARLIENLLAYSRINDVADTYSFVPIEIAAIFNDVQDDFEARLDHDDFDLQITIAPATPSVNGDRLALRLLFGNLVDNAIKYSTVRRTIALRAAPSTGRVTIEVADAGVGIPADELPHVVKKFARGRAAAGGGSGLGLAIVSRITEDHGGTLKIQSAVDVGTTVTVTLPADPAGRGAPWA